MKGRGVVGAVKLYIKNFMYDGDKEDTGRRDYWNGWRSPLGTVENSVRALENGGDKK